MDDYGMKVYEDLAKALKKSRESRANIIIASIPGLGISHLLKADVKKEGGVHISRVGEKTEEWNVLDFGWDINAGALAWTEEYFRQGDGEAKFAVAVTDPPALLKEAFIKSYISNHIYSTYYHRASDEEDTAIQCRIFDPKTEEAAVERIYDLGGGIPQLTKFLLINWAKTEVGPEVLAADDDLGKIIRPTAAVISRCNDDILEKTGVIREGKIVSAVLREFLKIYQSEKGVDIKVNFDLTLEEDGEGAKERLTDIERRILETMMGSGNQISREGVSDIKWGEGKYDEFSDQAINKSMRRLDGKLTRYKITTIPKVGYKIEHR